MDELARKVADVCLKDGPHPYDTQAKRDQHFRDVLEEIDALAADTFNGTFVNIDALTISGLRALVAGVNTNAEKILALIRKELRLL